MAFPNLSGIFLIAVASAACAAQAAAAELRFSDSAADVAEVVELMAQRLELMESVAAWKYAGKIAIVDEGREQKVLEATLAQARTLGIDGAAARELFSLQIGLARQIQQHYVDEWRNGRAATAPLRDLDSDLRPALDVIGARLLRAIYVASPELERPDFQERYSALRDRVRTPQLQAVLAATDADALIAALGKLRRAPTPALSRIHASGILRIGMTGDYAPFSVDSANAAGSETISGADVDTAIAYAASLGAQPRFVRTSWPTLMQDYRAGRFDLAISGISVTPDRATEAAFSLPYHRGGKTPIVRCGTQADFDTLAEIDRPAVRIVVNPGGTNERFVREHVTHAQLIMHADNRTIFNEVAEGRADVMVTDDVEVELQTRRNPALCRAMAGTLTQGDKAILLPRDDEFVAATNRWLSAQIGEGAIERRLTAALAAAAK